MDTITKQVALRSADGADNVNNEIEIELDTTAQRRPITFYVGGKPVFSIGNAEIHQLTEALTKFEI